MINLCKRVNRMADAVFKKIAQSAGVRQTQGQDKG